MKTNFYSEFALKDVVAIFKIKASSSEPEQ